VPIELSIQRSFGPIADVKNGFLHYKILEVAEMRKSDERARADLVAVDRHVKGLLKYKCEALLGTFSVRTLLRRSLRTPEK